jgi:hypothetical protein
MYHRLRDAALLELQFLREHHNGEVALLLSRLEQAKLAAQVRLWSVPCDGLFGLSCRVHGTRRRTQ